MCCLAAVALAARPIAKPTMRWPGVATISSELSTLAMMRLALTACLLGVSAGGSICGAGRAGAVVCTRRLAAPRWLLLRGGADELDEELEDDDGDDIDAEVCVVPWRKRKESSYTALEKARQTCKCRRGEGCETDAYSGISCLACRCRLGDEALEHAKEKLHSWAGLVALN